MPYRIGINENTNLIRQYFTKHRKPNSVAVKQIREVMDRLNNRPRQT